MLHYLSQAQDRVKERKVDKLNKEVMDSYQQLADRHAAAMYVCALITNMIPGSLFSHVRTETMMLGRRVRGRVKCV